MKKGSIRAYLLGGACIGAVNGLLGGEGACSPCLFCSARGLQEKNAHATAIAVIAPASFLSGAVYLVEGLVPMGVFLPVALGVLLGGALGAKLLGKLSSQGRLPFVRARHVRGGREAAPSVSFYLFFLCGVLGGVLGGMGMGGGTALIPLLTLLLGVPQAAAQGVNLLSFFPMAALALTVHAKKRAPQKGGGSSLLVLPALALSAAAALLAAHLPALLLRRAFGSFLVALSLFRLASAKKKRGRG